MPIGGTGRAGFLTPPPKSWEIKTTPAPIVGNGLESAVTARIDGIGVSEFGVQGYAGDGTEFGGNNDNDEKPNFFESLIGSPNFPYLLGGSSVVIIYLVFFRKK